MTLRPNQVPTDFFDTDSCNLFSQLLPASQKRFIKDFVNGNLFRNPIQKVSEIISDRFPAINEKLNEILGFGGPGVIADLEELNKELNAAEKELAKFNQHASRLSGMSVEDGLASFQEIFSIMTAYNAIMDTLKDSGQLLKDNFSNAFSALKPNISGPVLSNLYDNLSEIENLLAAIGDELGVGGLTGLGKFTKELSRLVGNLKGIYGQLETIINNDNGTFANALALVERYALGNTLISSSIIDPCFGARIVKNFIMNPEASKSIDGIAEENGVKIGGSPVDAMDYFKYSKASDALKINL